jgi:A/G-specific adenine glycosylase
MASPERLRTFQQRLLAWYRVYHRRLPWRKTRDPYKILVSEIMLQQTQVDRVVPKYHEFLERYPTVRSLAGARAAELRKVWYPLGYNVRPLRLRRIAQRVLRDHAGRIPDTSDGLLAMDGIGRYTAGAVLSFAFRKDAPIVDTNVARLLSRYFAIRAAAEEARPGRGVARTPACAAQGRSGRPVIGAAGRQRRLWQLAEAVIPPGRGHLINQAMMDFGAMVCTARAPRCPTCVLRRTCRSYPLAGGGPPLARSRSPSPPHCGGVTFDAQATSARARVRRHRAH